MKLLKQASTMVLASTLLLTVAPTGVWADNATAAVTNAMTSPAFPGQIDTSALEAKITKEQALEHAKAYITLPADYTFQSISLNAYYGMNGQNIPTWNISYSKKVKERFYGSANISINALDGTLTSYSLNDNDPDHKPTYPPKVDFQGAKDLAAAFVAKVNPTKQKELIYDDSVEKAFRTPLDGNYQYNIRYDRSVGGVPFSANGLNVNVNGDGQITGYGYNWDDKVTFDTTSTPITKEKAIEQFRAKTELSLQYQIPYNAQGKRIPIIAYLMNGFALDAATGEVWNPTPSLSGGNKPLTDKPLGANPPANLNLTKEEAVKKVVSTFNLSADFKLQEANYNESKNPETGETTSSWNMSWNKSTTDATASGKMIAGNNVWATVNSKTGAIINFNFYVPYNSETDKPIEGKVSLDDAIAKSTDFVKAQLPASTDQLVLSVQKEYSEETLKQMRTWEISYKRVIDGVIVGNEEVRVSIDRVTGSISSYYVNLSDVAYPTQKPEVISIDKAKELWLSQFDVKLGYVLEGNGFYGPMPIEKYRVMMAAGEIPMSAAANGKGESKAKLVYSLISKNPNRDGGFLLDAASGQWRSAQSGEVISLDKVVVSDIDKHWAQNELQLMLDYQALDVKDGKVNPDQTIKRGELVKMLVIAMNGGNGGIYYGAERAASFADVSNGSKYFAYVENAVDRGLLDVGKEFNPEATMDREAMAQLIVKALGYHSLTKFDGVFNNQFADADKLTNVGDAAIVVGLNIMSLNDGNFAPQAEVTKAQAATAFYRFLQKRSELQEKPRYYY
ncbi:S-layer homology domain-containing protein [Paenibacillus qinlingensis]|uniref:SLH domain-containing protein n=1 Tax=Paenibacillus qinlingensis TaxID=1837343 RepID=A0ABU1P3P7_9BACL|nr:S-layer homology domain-containing protein [Paenibacillus qinlingensis]MDR6554371.1 hypothetical protein [Paenibacillus qinlingensis]